jgi:hypothetical protein
MWAFLQNSGIIQSVDYIEVIGRIQHMNLEAQREALYHKIQEEKKLGKCTLTLEKKLYLMDEKLDCMQEPSEKNVPEEKTMEKLNTLFKRGAQWAQMKPFSLSYLIKGHPKAHLARLIPEICRVGRGLNSSKKRVLLDRLEIESKKAWNKELYSTGFLKFYNEWISN